MHLTKKFGGFTAVNDVSFEISRGEIFGFLGSNGCGKSTTMKMLTGLLEPTGGEALIMGETFTAGDRAVKRKVGYMSQAFSLYEELTVTENLFLHATHETLHVTPHAASEAFWNDSAFTNTATPLLNHSLWV